MVNRVGSTGIDPAMFDDPAMAAEAAMIDALGAERSCAREEQRSARVERDAHFERSQREEGYAANARMASGWIGAAGRILEGAVGVATAGPDEAGRSSAGAVTVTDSAARRARIEGGTRALTGALSAAGAAVDFLASGHGAASRAAEHARTVAHERAEQARERAAGASEVAARMLGRLEELGRSERQAADQRIANLRG
jgi:hypothetical protein